MPKLMNNSNQALWTGFRKSRTQARKGAASGHLRQAGCFALVSLAILGLVACSSGGGTSTTFTAEAGQGRQSAGASSAGASHSGPIKLTPTQRKALESLLSQPGTSPEMLLQAQIILAVAAGMDNAQITRQFGAGADKIDLDDLLNQLQ